MNKLSTVKALLQEQKVLKDINFLNHIGYFCLDPKKAKTITQPRTLEEITTIKGEQIKITYTVTPFPGYGYPSNTAFQILDFIERFLTYYGRPATNPIPFEMKTLREVLRLAKSGQNDQRIKNALYQLRFTPVMTTHFFLDRNRKWVEGGFTILKDLILVGEKGKEEEDKEIKGGLMYLNKSFLKSFNNRNHMPIGTEEYSELPAPTKVLFLKFFRAFSAQMKKGEKEISYSKDYDALCEVMGFTPQKHKSRATQQLKPHLDPLKDDKELISDYEITKRKGSKKLKLTTSPGKTFFELYQKFNKPKQLDLPFRERDKKIVEAIEAVRYFYEQIIGAKFDEKTCHVTDRELKLASLIITKLPTEKIQPFIDYALTEAKQTNFQIKTFNGVESYLNHFSGREIKRKQKKMEAKLRKETEQKQKQVKKFYEQFLNETYSAYIKKLKSAGRKKQEETIHKKTMENSFVKTDFKNKGNKSLIYQGQVSAMILKFTKESLIKENYFEIWLKKQGKKELIEIPYEE